MAKIGLLAVVVCTLCNTLLFADSSKMISPDLAISNGSGMVKVIVHYAHRPTPASLLNLSQLGGLLIRTYNNINAVAVTLPQSSIEIIASSAGVDYVAADRPLTQLLDYSSAAINAAVAYNSGLTGLGVGVAVIDSGIADSPDLSVGRIVYRENFVSAGTALGAAANDGFGHGTHVAGIIAGSGASSQCLNCTRLERGIAPNATLLDLRVLDANGQGSDSSVLAAIDRAIQLKNLFNVRIINLSLGRPIYESYKKDALCQAVEAAWKAGIVVVVAAGNSGRDNAVGNNGYGTIQSPANDPLVITVGAMKAMGTYPRTDDLIASYSSKGPSAIDFIAKPDLVAPGNHVVSLAAPSSTLANDPATAVPVSHYQATTAVTRSSRYLMLNGTSMATPAVSGSVADLLQSEPSLTPDQVKARLMRTAYKQFPLSSVATDTSNGQQYTSTYDLFTVGAGYVDLGVAITSRFAPAGTALSPVTSYDPANGTVRLSLDPMSIWAAQPGWGTQVVWGTRNVGANQTVWGTQAVWGTSTATGFRAIWGTSGVWGAECSAGSATVDGTRTIWGTSSRTSDSDTTFSANK